MCWRRFHFRNLLINALGRFGRIARAHHIREEHLPPTFIQQWLPQSLTVVILQ